MLHFYLKRSSKLFAKSVFISKEALRQHYFCKNASMSVSSHFWIRYLTIVSKSVSSHFDYYSPVLNIWRRKNFLEWLSSPPTASKASRSKYLKEKKTFLDNCRQRGQVQNCAHVSSNHCTLLSDNDNAFCNEYKEYFPCRRASLIWRTFKSAKLLAAAAPLRKHVSRGWVDGHHVKVNNFCKFDQKWVNSFAWCSKHPDFFLL